MSEIVVSGRLRKMRVESALPARYHLRLDDQEVELNPLLGRTIRLRFSGIIRCLGCDRQTRKSFAQGYCYRCFTTLAECDRCVMAPEHCHHAAGTCRDPAWGEANCMTGHLVYLANSSGVKVGLTRLSQVPVRWLDQGAVAALPVVRTATRQQAGLVEDLFRQRVSDRTQWQRMLSGPAEEQDLATVRDELFREFAEPLQALGQRFGLQAIELISDAECRRFEYPVRRYPDRVRAHNLDRTPEIEGVLQGIKGQYLILDSGVINIRKYGGYEVRFSAEEAGGEA